MTKSFTKKLFRSLIVLFFGLCIALSMPSLLTRAAAKPAKPVIKLKQGTDSTSVTISIKKTAQAEGYLIYMKSDADDNYRKIKTLKKDGNKVRTFTVKNLNDGNYKFRVKAYLKDNGKTVKGAYSKVKSISLKLTEKNPGPTEGQQNNKIYLASVTENIERMKKEAIEQYNTGDYTPLSEPVKYNVLWLGFTHVTYGELDFRMTDFDREYLQAVTLNFEKSVEEITNHNLDITVELHFIDDVTPLTKTDYDDWLYLAQETVQYVIDKYTENHEFDTVLTTIQTAGKENESRNEMKENYGVNYAMLGLKFAGIDSPMGYSTFDLQEPIEGTYPLADPKIPSLYATAVAVHEWMHQLEYIGEILHIEYPETHAYFGPESYPGYQKYISDENDYDFFEFYKLVLQGKLPYNDGTTVKYVGMYPKMWPLIKRNVFNVGKFVIKDAKGSGYLSARDENPMLFISDNECIWNIKYLSEGRFTFSPEKMAYKLIDLCNACDWEDNSISLYIYTGYLDAQSWWVKENSDGTCSLQTPYKSGRLLTIRDQQGAFLCSDGADGVQDWIIEPH